MSFKIKNIFAREILDSRGDPTVFVKVNLEGDDHFSGSFAVPSGASAGIHEALELRDNDHERYNGKGVLKAVASVNKIIASAVASKKFESQEEFDQFLIDLDGTENKSKLGANAILGASVAFSKACAFASSMKYYEYLHSIYKKLGGTKEKRLPSPSFNVLNGGKHASNGVDFQEFMICPINVDTFSEKVRCGAEIFHALKEVIIDNRMSCGVGDEGGFAPMLLSNIDALKFIKEAVLSTSWRFGKDVFIVLDPAASSYYKDGKYVLLGEKSPISLSTDQMITFWENLTNEYPIIAIEDGLAEDDWDGWVEMNKRMGSRVELIGDDLLVTNTKRIDKAIELKACNSVLIKLNQIGTLTETLKACILAQENGMKIMISHRSAETSDSAIADLAVAVAAEKIKSGSLCRSERLVKYNRLMEIEEELK